MAGWEKAMSGLSGSKSVVVVGKGASPGAEGEQKFRGEQFKYGLLLSMARAGAPFRVPEVYEVRPDQMWRRYIPGRTLEQEMEDTGAAVWRQPLGEIIKYLRSQPGPFAVETDGDEYYHTILAMSDSTVEAGRVLDEWLTVRATLYASEPFPPVLTGFNHGDLAFDNIIVDDEANLWLIDPLINRFETPWWDIGKILQSTYCNWPALREGRIEPVARDLRDLAEVFLAPDRATALFFLLLVLLRIIRHAPYYAQKQAILTEAIRVGREYVSLR